MYSIRPAQPPAQPPLEVLDVLGSERGSIRDPHRVEAERQGLILNLLFQAHTHHYTMRRLRFGPI